MNPAPAQSITSSGATPDASPSAGPDGLPSHVEPAWFQWAVQQPRQSHWAPCDGIRIHYVSWNDEERDKPALLFAHGFLGHTHWWDFIAPFFTKTHRVYAMDFSGMGDSEHRPSYNRPLFANDIAAVVAHAGLAPVTVVGHSFAGSVLMYDGCARLGNALRHAIVVDSFGGFPDDPPRPHTPMARALKIYATQEEALSRFRLKPDQPCAPWVHRYLAQHSMRQHSSGGWCWRFDAEVLGLAPPQGDLRLDRITQRFDYVYGEDSSVVSPARAARLVAGIPGAKRGAIGIPSGLHHLMLDQPLALIGTLRALLG